MRANYSLLISWLQIWLAARSTCIAFAYLSIPFAFTCILSELKRIERQEGQRVVGCITYSENGHPITIVRSRVPGCDDGEIKQLIQRCDLHSGKVEELVTDPSRRGWSPCWLSQSGGTYPSTAMSALWSFELARQLANSALPDEFDSPSDVQISRDGQYLVSLADECLRVYNLARDLDFAAPPQPKWQSLKNVEAFSITPDCARLVFVERNDSSRWLTTVDIESGSNTVRLAPVPASTDRIITGSDTSEVAVVCGFKVYCFSLNSVSGALLKANFTTGLTKVATISPNGDRFVTTTSDAMHLIIWNRAAPHNPRQIACSVPIEGAHFLDEGHVLTWSLKNKLLIWSLETNNVEREIVL